jgi:hypothetical protein
MKLRIELEALKRKLMLQTEQKVMKELLININKHPPLDTIALLKWDLETHKIEMDSSQYNREGLINFKLPFHMLHLKCLSQNTQNYQKHLDMTKILLEVNVDLCLNWGHRLPLRGLSSVKEASLEMLQLLVLVK